VRVAQTGKWFLISDCEMLAAELCLRIEDMTRDRLDAIKLNALDGILCLFAEERQGFSPMPDIHLCRQNDGLLSL
jgi:hypothetical protein